MNQTFGARGFVTIATGAARYYDLAVNLLHSYRFFCSNPYPFAIICDHENEHTAEFDNVLIIPDPNYSYNDKLRLDEFLPYDETIFIDADSLAYGDLNAWWDLFSKMDDFSVFGYAYRDLTTAKRWFRADGMREFTEYIGFVPDFNGGVYYLRNTDKCRKVFELARYCAEHYHDYAFAGFREPADEPVLALGMAVCDCEPLNEDELIFAPTPKNAAYNITAGKALRKGSERNHRLIHWSNYLTLKSQYRLEVKRLNMLRSNDENLAARLLYGKGLALAYFWIYDIGAFCFRVWRKLKQIWRRK